MSWRAIVADWAAGDSPNNALVGVFSALLLLMALAMLPSDREHVATVFGESFPDFVWVHLLVRLFVVAVALILMARAVRRASTERDYIAFLIVGTLYACEGSLFNTSYYLALVQVMGVMTWFSPLLPRVVVPWLVASGFAYSLTLWLMLGLGHLAPTVAGEYAVGVWVVTAGAGVAAHVRERWHQVARALRAKSDETGARLMDLGRQLQTIFHDMNNSLTVIRGHADIIRDSVDGDDDLTFSLSRMRAATDHILALQQFVLEMSRDGRTNLRAVSGKQLAQMMRDLVRDLCERARPYVVFEIDESASYYCSPSALIYAVANAVNNSADAFAGVGVTLGQRQQKHKIGVRVQPAADGGMDVLVYDDGPGFPLQVLRDPFRRGLSTKGEQGHGVGMCNIQRYVSYQGGTVRIFNQDGAHVSVHIPAKAPI